MVSAKEASEAQLKAYVAELEQKLVSKGEKVKQMLQTVEQRFKMWVFEEALFIILYLLFESLYLLFIKSLFIFHLLSLIFYLLSL